MLSSNEPPLNEVIVQPWRRQVPTELDALVEVLQWFEEIVRSRLPPKILWECKLALAEGFTNTVRYAHQNLPSTVPILVEINFAATFLEIRIWDIGPPFDLHAKLAQLQAVSTHPLEKESDRGLFFMQQLTDDLQYLRIADSRNCLILRKNLHS